MRDDNSVEVEGRRGQGGKGGGRERYRRCVSVCWSVCGGQPGGTLAESPVVPYRDFNQSEYHHKQNEYLRSGLW